MDCAATLTDTATSRTNGEEAIGGSRLRRRIDRFRRAGLLAPSSSFTVEQAITEDELRQAYALVHDVFLEQKYIVPQMGGLRLRPYVSDAPVG